MSERKRPLPSIARIRELLDYDRETGIFRWKTKRRGNRSGQQAGHFNKESGYWFVRVDDTLIRSHRLAWAWVRGYWPEEEIDHKDRNRGNCRFANLRKAARVQNAANMSMHPKNTTGVAGVSLTTSRKRFRAEIHISSKRIHLGYFDSLDAAGEARKQASIKYRGKFAPEHGAR